MTQTTDDTIGDDALSGLIGYNMKRLMSLVSADLARVLAAFDLRMLPFSALSVIVRQPGISQTELAGVLSIERSNLVQIIDDLAGRDFITRAPVAGDRRRNALMPTKAGSKMADVAQKAVFDHEARLFGVLSDTERDALLAMLIKVRQAVDQ